MKVTTFGSLILLGLGVAAQTACTTSTGLKGKCQNEGQGCDGVSELSRACSDSDSCCVPATSNPKCAHPVRGDCSFYSDCLESRYHCGEDGYPIGYGLLYCHKFQADQSSFTERGQKWMNDVMQCLQRDLVPEATNPGATATTSCADIKMKAFESHSGCYINSGLCTLPVRDWFVILHVVGPKGLLGGLENVKEVLETAGDCLKFYNWLVWGGWLKTS